MIPINVIENGLIRVLTLTPFETAVHEIGTINTIIEGLRYTANARAKPP